MKSCPALKKPAFALVSILGLIGGASGTVAGRGSSGQLVHLIPWHKSEVAACAKPASGGRQFARSLTREPGAALRLDLKPGAACDVWLHLP